MNDLFIQKLTIDWNCIDSRSYLKQIESLKELREMDFCKSITLFTGENGSGKSTLLEAIAVAYGFNPEGGTKNYSFSTYDSHSELHHAITLSKSYRRANGGYFLRAESFYNVATKEMEYADAGHPSQNFHCCSHGESFMTIAQTQLRGNGLFILDEPEAALSPQRQLALLLQIHESARNGSQFIIATHSPILLAAPGAEILSFDGSIHRCGYEETASYQITKMFMDDREQILEKLL